MRTVLCTAALGLSLVLSSGLASGQMPQASAVSMRIETQPLDTALNAWASQTGYSVLVPFERAARGKMAPKVEGMYTPEAALRILLANTDLQYEFVNARTVSIRPAKAKREAADARAAQSSIQLARADQSVPQSARGTAESASAATDPEQDRGIPEMLVTGSRSTNLDNRRTEDDAQPYLVFEQAEIERSSASNLEDFFRTNLPMNTTLQSNAQTAGLGFGNVSSINLRGLGDNETLILVNGRRLPNISHGTEFAQPDINGISMAQVERIEVLPSTAGGIYGSGATGGVINIILKSNYNGMQLSARYDNVVDGDAAQRRIDGTTGYSFNQGKTRLTFSGAYSDANPLRVGERNFASRARQLQLQNNPAAFYDATNPPAGRTTNIRSVSGNPLVLKVGSGNRSLGANKAYVPYGYAGPASDGGAAFLSTAGKYNLELPPTSFGTERALTVAPEMLSGSFNLRHKFSERFEAFMDGGYNQNDSWADGTSTFTAGRITTLTNTASNNPFTESIRVQFPGTDMTYGLDRVNQSLTRKVGGGLIVRLPKRWTMQAQYDWGTSERHSYSGTSLTSTGITALGNGTLNIMRDVEAFPLDYSPYYFTPNPSSSYNYTGNSQEMSIRAAGPIFRIAGGPVNLSTMIGRRMQEKEDGIIWTYGQPTTGVRPPSYSWYPERDQTTDSAYAEFTAPLFSKANALRFVRSLELQASYRYDATTTRTPVNNASISIPDPDALPTVAFRNYDMNASQYIVGLRYQPVESIAMRASFSAGVRPPLIGDTVPTERANCSYTTTTLRDPKRGNTLFASPVGVVARCLGNGNPNIGPEQSRGVSAGVIFTPKWLDGLRVALDYTRTRKTDEIDSLDNQLIINLEDQLPGRIVRAPLTTAEQALGYTGGQVLEFDTTYFNVALTEVVSYDVKVDYRWTNDNGTFRARLVGTYQPDFIEQPFDGQPIENIAGFAGAPLMFRGNAGLTWEREGWTAGWSMQYVDSYFIYPYGLTPAQQATDILDQGSNTFPSRIYHDLVMQYRFDSTSTFAHGFLAGTQVSLNINNILDTMPPVIANSIPNVNSYSTYGDPRMRRYSIGLRKDFK